MIDKEVILRKIVGMFRPYSGEKFLDYSGTEVVYGPNDRAMIGFDTHFPKDWLIEDFGFTDEEADWFIEQVRSHDNSIEESE